MNIEELIKKLEVEFDELQPGALKADTNFRDLEEWSSMHALIIIAMIDTEYDVMLNGEDLKNASTVGDLHQIIAARTTA